MHIYACMYVYLYFCMCACHVSIYMCACVCMYIQGGPKVGLQLFNYLFRIHIFIY
uniref:Uncharacterized protein n=1 Tax=Octopus bimaculoides TaxID=37653 RepID=A0A0L8FYN5_OCTBM